MYIYIYIIFTVYIQCIYTQYWYIQCIYTILSFYLKNYIFFIEEYMYIFYSKNIYSYKCYIYKYTYYFYNIHIFLKNVWQLWNRYIVQILIILNCIAKGPVMLISPHPCFTGFYQSFQLSSFGQFSFYLPGTWSSPNPDCQSPDAA